MPTLDELRDEIAVIDAEIIRLAGRRVAAAQRIGEIKREQGMDIVVPAVEEKVVQRYIDGAPSVGISEETAKELAELLIAACRNAQR